jgi:hypothetical protein
VIDGLSKCNNNLCESVFCQLANLSHGQALLMGQHQLQTGKAGKCGQISCRWKTQLSQLLSLRDQMLFY